MPVVEGAGGRGSTKASSPFRCGRARPLIPPFPPCPCDAIDSGAPARDLPTMSDATPVRDASPASGPSPFADLAPAAASAEPARETPDADGANREPAAVEPPRPIVAELYGTNSNPVPDGARAEFVTTDDGVRLRAALFRATRRPRRGTVLLLQGRNECIEKYFETARDLGAAGFTTVAFDWRGQGGSDRLLRDPQKGYVRSFRDYERDLLAIYEGLALPDARAPFTIVGHSMGGLIAMLAAPQLAGRVERIVALAPLVRLIGQPLGQRTLKWAMGLARLVGLGRLYAAGGPRTDEIPDFLTNVLTTDPVRHERNGEMFLAHPHLGIGGPTVRWVHEACRAMDRLGTDRALRALRVPTLVIAAGDDGVVSTLAQERVVRRMRCANMLTVDGARHELLQERDRYRGQAIAAIVAFAATDDARTAGSPVETTEPVTVA